MSFSHHRPRCTGCGRVCTCVRDGDAGHRARRDYLVCVSACTSLLSSASLCRRRRCRRCVIIVVVVSLSCHPHRIIFVAVSLSAEVTKVKAERHMYPSRLFGLLRVSETTRVLELEMTRASEVVRAGCTHEG
jgi:hypothetical protein